jgi:hypothetical protein
VRQQWAHSAQTEAKVLKPDSQPNPLSFLILSKFTLLGCYFSLQRTDLIFPGSNEVICFNCSPLFQTCMCFTKFGIINQTITSEANLIKEWGLASFHDLIKIKVVHFLIFSSNPKCFHWSHVSKQLEKQLMDISHM